MLDHLLNHSGYSLTGRLRIIMENLRRCLHPGLVTGIFQHHCQFLPQLVAGECMQVNTFAVAFRCEDFRVVFLVVEQRHPEQRFGVIDGFE